MQNILFVQNGNFAGAYNIRRGTQDAALYRRLSENAPEAHDALYVGMAWTDLVSAFLDDPENRSGWVEANNLETLIG